MTATTGTVVDARDGKVYKTVLMPDGKWWMAENLAWAGAGVDYANNPANRAVYGRLYTWSEALVAPFQGTHLPSDSEASEMSNACGNPDDLGVRLRSLDLWNSYISGNGTDDYGFAILPCGARYANLTFGGIGNDSTIWTSTSYNTDNKWYRRVGIYSTNFARGYVSPLVSYSVRLIVDSGNIPDPLFFFLGAPISGLERGYSASIDRHVTVREAIGGGVRLIPRAPAQSDVWTVDAEVMLTAAQAGPFEAAVGAYGSDSTGILNLPARGGASTFAGLAPASFGADADTYIITAMRNPDAMGRRAVAVDLFAYRVQFDLIGSANAPIALTSTVPDWLPKKFSTHALRDSSQWNIYASPPTGFPIHPAAKVKHGRGQGHTIALDALDDSQADHLTAWYRNSRSAPVTITIDRGIAGQGAVSVYLVDLSLARDVGLHWSGSLEVVEA